MTDDLGMRKAGRRRRTTRRLTRRAIRVPGDDVPRQSKVGDDETGLDGDEHEHDAPATETADSGDRPSVDMLDVDLEVDGEQPFSGVVLAPPRAPISLAPPLAVSLPKAVAMHASVPFPVPGPATAASLPPPAPLSVPPPATTSVPPPALDALPPERERRDSVPDEKTNPQIRLARSHPPATSHPPRVPNEEADLDTNPRIPIEVEEESSVIVTRSRVITDRLAGEYDDDIVPTRPSRLPPASVEVDDIEPIDLDDEAAGKLELPALPGQGVAARPGEGQRSSKAPPPPMSIAPRLPPRKAGANVSVTPMPPAAASQAPQPPAMTQKAPPPPPPGTPKKSTAPVAPAAGAPKQKRRSWWEDFFSDDYLHSVIRPTAAQISGQVDFIESSLGLSKGQTVLDVGCGLGLHALELARRGYLVVGLDLSLPMITRAAEAAQQEGLRINFLHSDLREIGFQGMFDAIVCVGTTFGFFDDDTNRDVLARLCASLKPGGRLLLDVVNRDHVISSQPNLVWFEGDGCVVMEESDVNYFSSRLVVKRTMMRDDGRQSEAEYSLRLYALHELGQIMQQAGFRVNEVSGQEATRGVFFGSCSVRIIMLAERRAKVPNGSVVAAPPEESSSDSGKS